MELTQTGLTKMHARTNRVLFCMASSHRATLAQFADIHGNGKHAFWRRIHTTNVEASYHQLESFLESQGFSFTEYREPDKRFNDDRDGWYVFDRPREDAS